MADSLGTVGISSNCNLQYISSVRNHVSIIMCKDPELAKKELTNTFYNHFKYKGYGAEVGYTFRACGNGIFVFTQGSEDREHIYPYGWVLAEFIRQADIGNVIYSGPAPNPSHGYKIAALWAWVVDMDKLRKWWEAEHEKRNPKPVPKVEPVVEIPKPIVVAVPNPIAEPLIVKPAIKRRPRAKNPPVGAKVDAANDAAKKKAAIKKLMDIPYIPYIPEYPNEDPDYYDGPEDGY